MADALNALTLPLKGSRLVEASAGTGKTWTIAALYLRLVLGHGGADLSLGRPLPPAEILVMTFTKAATRELSGRIRARLVEAAAYFRAGVAANADAQADAFLQGLRASYEQGAPRDAAAWRLAAAAEAMDDASVHTIDAWCQRMLREHAFDSGCLFDEALQPNETQMLRQAAHDYWRQQVYPLGGAALDAVLSQWKNVAALIDDMRQLIEKPLAAGSGQGELIDLLAAHEAACSALRAHLKQGWKERAAAMRAWLDRALACKQKGVNLQAHHVRGWMEALNAWACDPAPNALELSDTAWQRLTRADLVARAKGPLPDDVPEGFDAIAPLRAAQQQMPQIEPLLRAHALTRVRARMQHLKQQAGRYGYADMLQRLDDALDEPRRGAHARQLRERIRAQYPAALIDEFQDTSPRQLSIFERVYDIAADDPARVLLLIGDPKQSIYAFRGADIHSYLRARRATAGRHHALGTNRRSTQPLVQALNELFGRAEARAGAGAFLFRDGAAPGGTEGLPFDPVQAQGRPEQLQRAGQAVPAFSFCVDPVLGGSTEYRARFAALCAERIVALLNDAGTVFVEPGRAPQRLRPGDIAVLVRAGVEAEAVQRALRRRNVASVYLSDKDSVYQRAEAADLLRLLQAVAEPHHVRLARAALATRLLGRTLPELLQLAADDPAFDALCEHLRTLHGVWQTQGVLAMLRRALHVFGLPARLLAAHDGEGERRLTDVLHLAELLQQASAEVEGEPALVRWLAGQIEASRGDFTPAEEQALRLESDADLVRVVTVHKSKGLEYPLVFVPFASAREGRRQSWTLRREAETGARLLELAPSGEDLQALEHEQLQEGLRLLYVALTRARHALWVGVAALKQGHGKECQWHRSALGSLVSGAGPRAPEQIEPDLQALAAVAPGVAVEVLSEEAPPLTRWRAETAPAPLPPTQPYQGHFDRGWALSSYSALVRDAAHGAAVPERLPARARRDDDDDEAPRTDAPADSARHPPWHRFPRGAFAGNFLHEQLEWLAGERFALDGSATLQQALARRCDRQGWGHRGDDIVAWLRRAVSVPLPPLGVPLAGIDGRVLAEMEFWLPADGLDAHRLDALCCEHMMPGAARPALTQRVLHGLLMGFADLVFEHGGRYWVLDYKSNALGRFDADYTAGAMQGAMLEHRYDVQAALYLLALHRLLRHRLGAAYEPARHLGGAIYYFLRGVAGPQAGCFLAPPPGALLGALDAMLLQAAANKAANEAAP